MSKTYDNPDYEKWLAKQPMRKGNGLSISDTITQDNQKIFMDWLDTCPVVEFRDIVDKKLYKVTKVDEDSSVWIYTVDFAVVKEVDA
jgi:hypothetical protein